MEQEPKKNYDYTGKFRMKKQRAMLIAACGARVEAHLTAWEVHLLDELIKSGRASSRRGALKFLVQQIPEMFKDIA